MATSMHSSPKNQSKKRVDRPDPVANTDGNVTLDFRDGAGSIHGKIAPNSDFKLVERRTLTKNEKSKQLKK